MFLKKMIPLSVKRPLSYFYGRYLKPLPRYCRLAGESGLNRAERKVRIVVSLTSYPDRMHGIRPTLVSLLNQTFKPDRIVLWLGGEQFANREEDLAKEILELRSFGVDIRWTRDIRSYTKLIPALEAFPEDIIVTCDDDILYPPDWLSRLYGSYRLRPDCIHCHRGHTIRFDEEGRVLPFLKWEWESMEPEPSYRNFLTGVGGVLYPPHCFDERVLNESLFMSLAPTCDDHWFWAMAVLNGRRIKIVEDGIRRCRVNLKSSTKSSLCKINDGADFKSNSDIVFERLCREFPVLVKRIS